MADDPKPENTDPIEGGRGWWQAFGRALLQDDLGDDGAADEIRDELRSLQTAVERITSAWFLAGPGREIDRRLARIERRLDDMAESRDRRP